MDDSRAGAFQDVRTFPDSSAQKRFAGLVGLDHVKERLLKEAEILLDPKSVEEWCRKHHKKRLPLIDCFAQRSPLFLLAGDVGAGKTAIAESVGDPISRALGVPVTLYALSLNTRGTGAVGEMTRLISMAFQEVSHSVKPITQGKGKPTNAAILLIDEADALAQSRESEQMHHEDRAGVNALIRGVDQLAVDHLPVIVIMCTNRLDAIDPAVRRRAADTFEFARPDARQRRSVLEEALDGVGLTDKQLDDLAARTGAVDGCEYGYTYSDIVRRLIPNLLLDAFPDRPIAFEQAVKVVGQMKPTPPFGTGGARG